MSAVIVSAVQGHRDKTKTKQQKKKGRKERETETEKERKKERKREIKNPNPLIAAYQTFTFKQDCSEDLYSLII